MGCVIFLNHLHARPTVLGDLIDVGPFEQAQADVCMAEAIGSSWPTVAVGAELFLLKNRIE